MQKQITIRSVSTNKADQARVQTTQITIPGQRVQTKHTRSESTNKTDHVRKYKQNRLLDQIREYTCTKKIYY